MNIEELKLILHTINSISTDASTAATLWLVLHYGGSLIFQLSFIGAVAWVAHRWAITYSASKKADLVVRHLRDHFNIGSGGSLISWECDRVLARVLELEKK